MAERRWKKLSSAEFECEVSFLRTLPEITWVHQLSVYRILILLLVAHPHHLPNAFFFYSLNMPNFKSFCLFLWKVCSCSGPISSWLTSPEKTYFPSLPSRNSRLYILHYIKWLNSSSCSLLLLTYTGITQCI